MRASNALTCRMALLLALLQWTAVQVAVAPPPPPPASQPRPQPAQPSQPAQLQLIRPDQVYYPSKTVLAAPSTAIGGPLLRQLAAATIEACSEACRSEANCSWFSYCSNDGGCLDGSGSNGTLAFQQCRLLGAACALPPLGLTNSTEVQVTSGERRNPLQLLAAGSQPVRPLPAVPERAATHTAAVLHTSRVHRASTPPSHPVQASPPPACGATRC